MVAVLSGTGTEIKRLENGQTAVNMYLFPLLDVGKGPTKSIFQACERDTSTCEHSLEMVFVLMFYT